MPRLSQLSAWCFNLCDIDHRTRPGIGAGYRNAPHWRRTVVFMPSPRNTSVCAARAIELALGLVEHRELRLRGIIESEQTTPDEKFEALIELARLTGILSHKMAEA